MNALMRSNAEMLYRKVGKLSSYDGDLYVKDGKICVDDRWFWNRYRVSLGDYSKPAISMAAVDTLEQIQSAMQKQQLDPNRIIRKTHDSNDAEWVTHIEFGNAILENSYFYPSDFGVNLEESSNDSIQASYTKSIRKILRTFEENQYQRIAELAKKIIAGQKNEEKTQ